MDYAAELKSREREGLLRQLRLRRRNCLEFSSNDYLGLAEDRRLKDAAAEAAKTWGTGVSASRLMCGTIPLHIELENELAQLTVMESAILFGSGFLANLGLLSAVTGRDDVIFTDRLNHASLIDGALMSRASVYRYRHCDPDHLEHFLKKRNCRGNRYVVTDSLFSMDGDKAPLRELDRLSEKYGCRLIVDEAHAIGVFGKGGGLCRELEVKPHALVGTLSKALGSYGGFVACSEELRKFLVNRARTFIYSTGLPPATAAPALKAANLVRENPHWGAQLLEKSSKFRDMIKGAGYSTGPSCSQIVPVIIGSSRGAVALSQALEERGISAVAVRPPTVPKNSARLRFSVTRNHFRTDLSRVVQVLAVLEGRNE
ncbi:MAG: 8-amino-7-oxononanoate synthase [Candidatus Aegiribacteria sp.]|nr:8-amino-7-oxononanoate synthase [Candidatus Aegiribacteria sp.]MBD3294015.1 8-amino-7-oxononanoate synthase [Candidatus Fermentibacteria bacterium]